MSAPDRTPQEWALLEARVRELESQLAHAAREIRSQSVENARLRHELKVRHGAVVAMVKRDVMRRSA